MKSAEIEYSQPYEPKQYNQLHAIAGAMVTGDTDSKASTLC